jgi:FkbM family methyltransferase
MASDSWGQRLAAGLVKFAIGVVVALILPVLTIFVLAPYWRPMQVTANSIALLGHFAVAMRGRDKLCSVSDVWAAVDGEQSWNTKARFRAADKVIATDGNLILVATPSGKFWIPAPDFDTLAEELAEQKFDEYSHDVRAGEVVLDCGANVGVYTRVALARGARTVVAIEIAPEPLACLRRTFEREIREGRVIVYPKGVWDKDATLRLTTNPRLASTADSVAIDRGVEGPEVQLTTIDELVSELHLPRVDLINMDIEGSESHALRGAARTLATFKPRLEISMEHKRSDPDVIPALVLQLNPHYQTRCGSCGMTTGRVQPEVLLAW